jgi:hypothetical protein
MSRPNTSLFDLVQGSEDLVVISPKSNLVRYEKRDPRAVHMYKCNSGPGDG